MKVFVAGGAGYIGSHAVYELLRAGHEVVVYDNLSTGRRAAVHPEARFYEGDILDRARVVEVLEAERETGAVAVALHFAAKLIVPESVTHPLAYYHNNVEGLRQMLAGLIEADVRHVVFSSTAAVYGEPGEGECFEESATLPINPYGETKLAAERMIQWVAAAHGMNFCVFRYFNVAGADASLEIGLDKDQLTHLVPLIMQTALGQRDRLSIFGSDYDTPDGTCIRDYIHVSDLARAHVLGAEHIVKHQESLLLNLGSGRGYSVREVVAEAEALFPFAYEYAARRPGDPARLIANIQKAREQLDWQPRLGLREILQSDYAYRKKLLEEG
ncbi:MAG: UDP-glucose 4-epimerase GalE [Coriobacteriales bacterium]|jgi:UDP-glucose 4-epimerase|nr:UDP-glucose 4-epimerase GalE [Coriobacteriales bacterium]